jgi:outer membrane protein OmpA-like peptidoglycan-associated protein
MSRILPTYLATTALALAAFTLPTVPAHAAGRFDGTWIIDLPPDVIAADDYAATCPALRLKVQITDNQVSGNLRRSDPASLNVVEIGGRTASSQVSGAVQPDGDLSAQWQNFHASGRLVGPNAGLTVQTECGPMHAHVWRLDDQTATVAAISPAPQAAMAETQTASAAPASQSTGYNVYFSFDKWRLTNKGQGVVDAAVTATQASETTRIAVLGKADLSGTDPYNMALSHRRADRVQAAMVAGGVPANRIDVTWDGDRNPPVPTAAGVRDAQNRVVEVAIR